MGPLGRSARSAALLHSALDFNGYDSLRRQVLKSVRSSPSETVDPAADLEAIRFQAACSIQSWWRSLSADSPGDCSYTPVMLGYTQEDLDSVSYDCRTILVNANLMSHLVSDAGV